MRVHGGGVREVDRAVAGDRGVVAERVAAAASSRRRARCPCRRRSRPRRASQTSSRPSGSSSMPSGRPPVSPDPPAPRPSAPIGEIDPSSVPVNTLPVGVDDDVLGADARHRDDGQRGQRRRGTAPTLAASESRHEAASPAAPPRRAPRPGARRAAAPSACHVVIAPLQGVGVDVVAERGPGLAEAAPDRGLARLDVQHREPGEHHVVAPEHGVAPGTRVGTGPGATRPQSAPTRARRADAPVAAIPAAPPADPWPEPIPCFEHVFEYPNGHEPEPRRPGARGLVPNRDAQPCGTAVWSQTATRSRAGLRFGPKPRPGSTARDPLTSSGLEVAA